MMKIFQVKRIASSVNINVSKLFKEHKYKISISRGFFFFLMGIDPLNNYQSFYSYTSVLIQTLSAIINFFINNPTIVFLCKHMNATKTVPKVILFASKYLSVKYHIQREILELFFKTFFENLDFILYITEIKIE